MSVKLELYKVFKEVAEAGNITATAQTLFISQSAVSQSIKQLEAELHTRLFVRNSRGVTLTAEGVDFLPYARQVYGQYLNLMEKYGKGGERKQRFGVSCQHYSFAVKAFVEMAKGLTWPSTNSPSARPARWTSSTTSPACRARSAYSI